MPDYQAVSQEANIWTRGHTFIARNPLGGQPMGEFFEERVVEIDGNAVTTQLVTTVNPKMVFQSGAQIPLRNPSTGELTGTHATHDDLQVLLYSLYWQAAEQRDAEQAPTP